jgi:hypothetical protein
MELSYQNLQDLLSGKKNLAVRKKMKKSNLFETDKEETIKEKTFRLYFHDGQTTKLSYISKQTGLAEISNLFNINLTSSIDEAKLLLETPDNEQQWFHREFKNGEKILIKTSKGELREELLKRYEYLKTTVARENGFSTKSKSETSSACYMADSYRK